MLITRTPLRMSFAGGGSDLPAFYRRESGAVLSAAVDKYIYLTVNRRFDTSIRVSYSTTEIANHVDEVQHELVRESMRLTGVLNGVEITSVADIPSGTGLGSSSTYTVGLLNALYSYVGRFAPASKLAREACQVEINRCGKPIGKQDQFIAAFGGMQFIQFNPDESVVVEPVLIRPDIRALLQQRLLLFYTGTTRSADSILAEQTQALDDREKFLTTRILAQLAHDLRASLTSGDLDAVGEILHAGWMHKRELARNITNGVIDEWYRRAQGAGAIGGKLLGAGGGGFLLLYAPVESHVNIYRALSDLRPITFNFDSKGSTVVYSEEHNT